MLNTSRDKEHINIRHQNVTLVKKDEEQKSIMVIPVTCCKHQQISNYNRHSYVNKILQWVSPSSFMLCTYAGPQNDEVLVLCP